MATRCEQRTIFAVVMIAARFCRYTRDATSRGEGGISDAKCTSGSGHGWMDIQTVALYTYVPKYVGTYVLMAFFLGQPPTSQLAGKTPPFKPPRIPHATSLHQAWSVPTSKHSCIFTIRIRPTAIPSLVEIGNFQTSSPGRWPAVEKHRPVGARGRPPKLTPPGSHPQGTAASCVGLLRYGVKPDGTADTRDVRIPAVPEN